MAPPGLAAVGHAGHRIAWVQKGVADWPGWAVPVNGHLVLDTTNNLPLLAERAREATDLLRLALRQGLL